MVSLQEARAQSDEALAGLCRDGDASAFDELVRRHKGRVYNLLVRFVGDREDALDLAQETFVRAWRGLDSFGGRARLTTWLCAIAANLARNRLRDRGRKGRDKGVSLEGLAVAAPGAAAAAASTGRAPDADAEAREMEELLQRCLDELPDHYRLPFVLRTVEDMSYDEIGETLGCPRGTVKSRLSQARKLLRARLEAASVL